MNSLIIDATGNKIFLIIIKNKKCFYKSHKNIKSNYEKLSIYIKNFLKKNKLSLKKINNIYVNRGPGSYAGIRNSLSTIKGISFVEGIDYYSFSFLDFLTKKRDLIKKITLNSAILSKYHSFKYKDVPSLCIKFNIKKNLTKPLYLG